MERIDNYLLKLQISPERSAKTALRKEGDEYL